MAQPLWKLESKSGLMVAIYALLESGYWNGVDLSDWADAMLEAAKEPLSWIVDISYEISMAEMDYDDFFQWPLIDNNAMLPDNFYECCTGLLLLKYDQRLIPESKAKDLIADLSDPGGVAGLQVESIAGIALNDRRLKEIRDFAADIIEFVEPKNIISKYPHIISA